MTSDKWDIRFLELANHVSQWSKDPSTKVGTIIVSDRRRIVSVGYNGMPRGVFDTDERLNDRPTKYKFSSHAERNALDNAECSVLGATLYATHFPCVECAKSIIQRGISRVVVSDLSNGGFSDRWKTSCDDANMMFSECGIKVSTVKTNA